MMNITRVAGPKHDNATDAISEIKRQLNSRILRHQSRSNLDAQQMADLLHMTATTFSRLRSFDLEGYTIDDMVMFLMRLGLFTVQIVQSEVPEVSIQFAKVH